jgi:hypothetical protein
VVAHKGAGEETRKQNQETCLRAIRTRKAESRDGGGHQRGKGKTAGRSKGERISNVRADDRESVYNIPRILLAENRER